MLWPASAAIVLSLSPLLSVLQEDRPRSVADHALRIGPIRVAAIGLAVIRPVAAARIGLPIAAIELLMCLGVEISVSISIVAAAEILLSDIGIA